MVFKFNLVAKRKMENCELHIITLFSVIQMYEQYHYDIKECPIFMNKNWAKRPSLELNTRLKQTNKNFSSQYLFSKLN